MEELNKKDNKSLVIIALIVAVAAAGFIYWWMSREEETTTNQNQNVNKILILPEDTTPPAQSDDPSATQRDSERLHDVRTLSVALKEYFEAEGGYPEQIAVLVTAEYLDSIPDNPEPGGQEYSYSGSGDVPYQDYELCYSLEMGIEGISSGEHCAKATTLATDQTTEINLTNKDFILNL
ncbi:MAG: hypothetical protein ABIB97_04130 [Patescibacteria group bacterium]